MDIRSESMISSRIDDTIKVGAFEVYANGILVFSRLSGFETQENIMLRSINSCNSGEELGIKDNFRSTRSN